MFRKNFFQHIEKLIYIYSSKLNNRAIKDVNILYLRYYYVKNLLNFSRQNYSNHLKFELKVTHELDLLDEQLLHIDLKTS